MGKFPTIGEYNQAIQKKGNAIFSTLKSIEFIPSKTRPIKVFLFGGGAYAAVFKGVLNNQTYALRFFLEAGVETASRYKKICSYLETINSHWKVSCDFLSDEIEVNHQKLPILKMDWIQGQLINDFVSANLHDTSVLSKIQEQIVDIAKDLDKNQIGHGDIQCGNIIVIGNAQSFQLKLIDYDGMYTPNQNQSTAVENGRSEFNHPRRNKSHFGPFVDRFPFWIMITALEALKFDSSLWLEVMQGGFNTLDNFLFTKKDFEYPGSSKLFERLKIQKKDSVDFYLNKVLDFSRRPIYDTELPRCFSDSDNTKNPNYPNNYSNSIEDNQAKLQTQSEEYFIIKCNKPDIKILSSNLEKLGSVPLELEKKKYSNKTVIATDGNELKRIYLSPGKKIISIEWVEQKKPSKKNNTEQIKSPPSVEKPKNNQPDISQGKGKSTTQTKGNIIKNPPKNQKNKNKSDFSGIITVVIAVIIPLAWLVLQKMNSNTESINNSEIKNNTQENETSKIYFSPEKKIRKFTSAEDARQINVIIGMLSPIIYQYWDLKNPSNEDIRERYYQAWRNTKDSKNEILSIEKVDDNEFNLKTYYTFLDLNDNSYYGTTSIVHFEFDDKGKILATYLISGEKTEIISNPNEELSDEELNDLLRDKIITFFELEKNQDIDKILSFLSKEVKYFLGEYSPTYSDIQALYNYKWKNNYIEEITLLRIARNDTRSFNIELTETRYNSDLQKDEQYNYIKKIDFDNENKIELYEIKDTEKISETENVSTDQNTNKIIPSDYLYITSLKYTPGPAIRKYASINSEEIAEFPSDKPIYVLGRTNSQYYKIYVDGITGYISKVYLERK